MCPNLGKRASGQCFSFGALSVNKRSLKKFTKGAEGADIFDFTWDANNINDVGNQCKNIKVPPKWQTFWTDH